MTLLWVVLILASIGSWVIKIAGLSLPESVVGHPKVQQVAGYLPVAILSALIATQLFDGGRQWVLDLPVLGGFAAAVLLLVLKRGFLTVFFGAIIVTALLRLAIG